MIDPINNPQRIPSKRWVTAAAAGIATVVSVLLESVEAGEAVGRFIANVFGGMFG